MHPNRLPRPRLALPRWRQLPPDLLVAKRTPPSVRAGSARPQPTRDAVFARVGFAVGLLSVVGVRDTAKESEEKAWDREKRGLLAGAV